MVISEGGKMKMAKDFLGTSSVSMKLENFKGPSHFKGTNGVHKVKHNGEPMYNVLMENYDVMLVNNMLCETLNPTNKIAHMYYMLKDMPYEQQKIMVQKFDSKNVVEKNQHKGKQDSKLKMIYNATRQ